MLPLPPLLSLVLLCSCLVSATVTVVSPASMQREMPSSFVPFGDEEKLKLPPASGRLFPIMFSTQGTNPLECDVSSAVKGAAPPAIALVLETEALLACGTMTAFYEMLEEETNITAAIVGTRSFYVNALAIGYTIHDDPSRFSTMVTYVVQTDFVALNSSTEQLVVSFDTDRGPFYDFSVSPKLTFLKTFFPIIFILVICWACYVWFLDYKKNGFHLRLSVQLLISVLLACITRVIYLIAFQVREYYLPVPPNHDLSIVSALMLWFPILFSTIAYVLAAFSWARVVRAMENNGLIQKLQLPVMIYYAAIVPIFIIIVVLADYFPVNKMVILVILLLVSGLLFSIMFLYSGIKVLVSLSKLAADLHKRKTTSEKRLTIFVIGSVSCWLMVVILSGMYFILSLSPLADPLPWMFYCLLRDVTFTALLAVILGLLMKINTPVSSSVKESSISSSQSRVHQFPKLPAYVEKDTDMEMAVGVAA